MNDSQALADLQKFLLQSTERIGGFLKALGHPKRYQILVLLLDNPKKANYLMKKLDIGKTALANHMAYLEKVMLVEKVQHGTYTLTQDARDLLQTIADIYSKSKIREFQLKRSIQTQYSRSYQRIVKVQRKVVSPEPVYELTDLSYLGAMVGVFKSLGLDLDVVTLGGYSGYAFIVNVAEGRLCPSGPTALSTKTWGEIRRGTEIISGWKLKVIGDNNPYPNSYPLDDIDKDRALKLFAKIKIEIDKNNRPVVLWGVPLPEYGIVIGYEGETYLCSTVRLFLNTPESPIPYDSLQAPGSLHAFLFSEKPVKKPENIDYDAISRALKFSAGYNPEPGYVTGPEAFKEWADALESSKLDDMSYHGNSRNGFFFLEAKTIAAKFLKQFATKYTGEPQAEHLSNAATECERIAELLNKFKQLFPFAFEGRIKEEKRIRGGEILRAIIPHEREVVSSLEQAIEVWS